MVASHSGADDLVDPQALTTYLADALGPAEEVALERHDAGHSNETFFLSWGERDLVVRRPPRGTTADTAHDVLREYRVLDALQETDVRVPGTVLCCADRSVIGAEFYVVERVVGDVIWDGEPERFGSPEHRRAIGTELVDALAEVHQVDYEAVGLEAGEFGYPDGYLSRQVDRWQEQFEWAFEVTAEERGLPAVDEVVEWLAANVPGDSPNALVHGDYMLNNVMYGPGEPPELVAIFDWELSTLGDPRFDLGWLLTAWWEPDDPNPVSMRPTPRTLMAKEGYSTRRELLDRYERRTGIEFTHNRFYRALAVFKRAAVGEMWFRRYLENNSEKDLYRAMGDHVPVLVDRVERIIDGNEPL